MVKPIPRSGLPWTRLLLASPRSEANIPGNCDYGWLTDMNSGFGRSLPGAIPTQLLKPQIIGFQVGLLIRHVPVFSLYDVPRVGNPAEDKQPQSHHS